MAFNKKKFLDALLAIGEPSNTPLDLSQGFAQYMAQHPFGGANLQTDAAVLTQKAKQDKDREEGALSKTFGWLMGPGHAVQNALYDIDELVEGDDSFGQTVKDIVKDVASGTAHTYQPLAEIAAIPGLKTPWEPEALSEFITKENTEHHGTGPITGKRLLEDRSFLGNDAEDHKTRNSILGLVADITTDPLSYVGLGISEHLGLTGVSKIPGVVKATETTAPKVLERAAATGDEVVTPKTFAPAAPSRVPEVFTKGKLAPDPVTGMTTLRGALDPVIKSARESEFGMTPVQQQILRTNLAGTLNPAAKKAASMAKANDVRLYEKLHPVEVPTTVPRNTPKYAPERELGASATSNIRGWIDEPRAINRADEMRIIEELRDEASFNKSTNIVDMIDNVDRLKHVAKGLEDDLLSRGYTFPEGRLSAWVHKPDVKTWEDVRDFQRGRPKKVRPTIAEDTLNPVATRFGDKFVESKGITPELVANTVKQIGQQMAEGVVPKIPIEAVSQDLKPVAIEVAERVKSGWGKNGKLTNYNPANQTNMYNEMWKEVTKRYGKDLKLSPARKRAAALSMTRAAEDYLLKTYNLRPMHWDGTGLRLTSVLAELGPKNVKDEYYTRILDAFRTKDLSKITDPVAKEAFVNALAMRHVEMGAVAKGIMEGFTSMESKVKDSVSMQKYLKWKRGDGIQKVKTEAVSMGATPKEAATIANLARQAMGAEAVPFMEPMKNLENLGANTIKAVVEGRATPDEVHKFYEAIRRSIGETPESIAKDVTGHKVWDSIALKIFTWYGKGDMAKVAIERAQAAEGIAKKRAELFGNMKKNFSLEEQRIAFYHAQNHFKGVVTPEPRIAALSDQILDYFENIVGSRSSFANFETSAFPDLGGSLAIRSRMTMEDLNRHLKAVGATFQFSGKSKVSRAVVGKNAEYGEGHWLRSWENLDVTKMKQDPASFMYDLDLAASRLMTEYSVIDDFAMRFGKRGGEGKGLVHHRVPKDLKFDPKIADDFSRLMTMMREGAWRPESDFGKMYIKGLRVWKTGVTIYAPSHHIRNLIGDSWLMWMAGHNNPMAFVQAKKILHTQRARYAEALHSDSFDMLRGLVSKEEQAWARTVGSDVILKKRGANVTADELYGEAMQRGLLLDASRAEDILDGNAPMFASIPGKDPGALRRFANKPLGGMAHKTATGVAEYREHFVRLAHFNAAVEKGITKEVAAALRVAKTPIERRKALESVYTKAAQEVRKWHPDGRDLTLFEQKWARNIIPFYAWQRKAIPLIIEGMVTRPSKITMYPKGMYAVQGAFGIDSPNPQDPFPVDQLFPDWMRSGGIGPIGDPQSENAISRFFGNLGRNVELVTGGEGGYTVLNPGNPFNDTVSQLGGMGTPETTVKGLTGMLTPGATIPGQAIFNEKFTGAPISKEEGGEGYGPWAAEQIPIVSFLQRFFEVGEEHQAGTEPGFNKEAFLNYLTGAGIKGSGQYLKSAEFDRRDAIRKKLKEAGMIP